MQEFLHSANLGAESQTVCTAQFLFTNVLSLLSLPSRTNQWQVVRELWPMTVQRQRQRQRHPTNILSFTLRHRSPIGNQCVELDKVLCLIHGSISHLSPEPEPEPDRSHYDCSCSNLYCSPWGQVAMKEEIFLRMPPPFSTTAVDLLRRSWTRKTRLPSRLQTSDLFFLQWAERFHRAERITCSGTVRERGEGRRVEQIFPT